MNSAIPEPAPSHPDLNAMPAVLDVQVTATTPAERATLGAVAAAESVAADHPVLEVRTDGDFPVRALSPILFVGDVALRECERVGEGVYRFVAPAGVTLKKNARVAIGWTADPSRATPTRFRFVPPQ